MARNLGLKLKHVWLSLLNFVKQTETIDESKKKWNRLARKNARYFVLTDQGEQISEEEFRKAGRRDYQHYIADDAFPQKRLAPFSERAVLEIGCGIGRITEFLAENFKSVTGIDISEEMIRQGRERLAGKQNVTLVATDGTAYPFSNETFDFIFSMIVFQHMPSKDVIKKNVREISRVLKPGGIAKIQLRGIPTSKANWFYGPSFTSNDLPELISGTSLSVVETEGEDTKYFWVWLERV